MSDQSKTTKPTAEKAKKSTQEQIIAGFNQLRQDQKSLITKITDLEQDLNEHSLVEDTLKNVDGERKCYRMIGGILCERTVKQVLPNVRANKGQLAKVIQSLNHQMEIKGKEINEYKEKYDIQIRREPSITAPPAPPDSEEETSTGVLVTSNS